MFRTPIQRGGYARVGLLVLGVLMWPVLFLVAPPHVLQKVEQHRAPEEVTETGSYKVVRVTDGDTIVVARGKEEVPVRLIGIDAPELHSASGPECFAEEARLRASKLLLGNEVTLVSDPTQEERDVYDRLLRYVFVDGVDFNEQMLKEGFVREYTHIVPYQFHEAFKEAARDAKENGSGLWGACR